MSFDTSDIAEVSGQIVDVFEDYCDNEGITIFNPDKEEYDREAGYEPGENAAIIFGEDYDRITAPIEDLILNNSDTADIEKAICETALEFRNILQDRGNRQITTEEFVNLAKRVTDVLKKWDLCK